MKIKNLQKKALSVLLSLTLVINLLSPALLSMRAFAQEVSIGPEQAEQTTAASDSAQASSETPVPAEEPAPAQEPVVTEDLAVTEPVAEIAPEVSPVPAEEEIVTPAEEEPVLIVESTGEPAIAPAEEPALDSKTPLVAEPSATPVPTPIPVWQDLNDKIFETSENVELSKEYVAPQNDKVKITFNQLPDTSGKLTIKEIKLSAEEITQLGALSDTAYDITSTMTDGTFEYDLTLPLPEKVEASEVEVKSAENVDQLMDSAQKVEESKEEIIPDTITIKGLNHFTVFVVTTPTPDTTQRVLINEVAPTATAEWIELFNNGTASVNLAAGTGWTIRNSANNIQSLSSLGTVAAAGRAVFNAPAGFLSNTAPETITLSNELGTTVDTVTISLAAPGIAVDHYPLASESVGRRTDGVTDWKVFATPTKNAANTTVLPTVGIADVGAVDAANGFPTWYEDQAGVRLQLCLGLGNGLADPKCVLPAAGEEAGFNPATAISFPNNFPSESFYYIADSQMNIGAGGEGARLRIALEAAFGTGSPAVNDQMTFLRVNFQMPTVAGALQANSSYTVNHPFGVLQGSGLPAGVTFVTDATGTPILPQGHARLEDGAVVGNFTALLPATTTSVSEFLAWDPAFGAAPAGYIGDGVTPHRVIGSPLGANFNRFGIEGPNVNPTDVGGTGVNKIEEHLFTVAGKLAGSTAPVITLFGTNPVNATQGSVYADAGATALDDADGNLTGSIIVTGMPVNTAILGAKTVTYTVSDSAGNTTAVTRTVNVVAAGGVDTTAPIITINGTSPASVVKGTVYTDAGATALDNVDGDITANIVTAGLPVNTSAIGTFTITYNVSDTVGNAATAVTRTVNVTADTTVPVITVLGNNPANVLTGASYTDAGATAIDNVDGNVTAGIVTTGLPINTTIVQDNTVVYTVTDSAGNTATATRTVHVADTLPAGLSEVSAVDPANGFPTWYKDSNGLALGLCLDQNGMCLLENPDAGAQISFPNNFGPEAFWWNAETSLPSGGLLVLALEAAFDPEVIADGNQVSFGRIRIRIPGLILGETYTVSHPFGTDTFIAEDDGTGTNTGEINSTSDIGLAPGGVFTGALASDIGPFLTWPGFQTDPALLVDDGNGVLVRYAGNPGIDHIITGSPVGQNFFRVTGPGINETTNLFSVSGKLADTTAPVITIAGANPVDVTQDTVYVDAGATATDDFDGAVAVVTTGLPVDTSIVGPKTVTYTATDRSGNIATATRTVNVTGVDTLAPVITLLGTTPVNIIVGTPYTDAGATAQDNLDGNITANIATVNPVNTAVIGAYTVTYNVSDAAGNAATQVTRTVNVVADTTLPVITLLGTNPASVVVGTTYADAGATASDNIDGNITANIVTVNNVNAAVIGTYTVTYNVSDTALNAATQVTRTVNVIAAPDVTAPVISLAGVNPVILIVGTPYTDAGATALDNIDGNITPNIVTVNPVNTAVIGTYTVTYNVSDAAGNAATQVTRTVQVHAPHVLTTITVPQVPAITGTTQTFTVATLDQVNNPITAAVIFASSNPAVGTINSATGVFTAVGAGTTVISATNGAIVGATIATVQSTPATATVNPAAPTVGIGSSLQFSGIITDQFGAVLTNPVTFSSSNPLAGTIDPSTGVFTPLLPGITTITASSGALSGTTLVTVGVAATSADLAAINVTAPTSTISVGGSAVQLTAVPVAQNGVSISAGITTTFVSNNTAVAVVGTNGIVTPVNAGKATIRVTSTNGTTTVKKDFNITVEISVEGTNLVSLITGNVFQPAVGSVLGATTAVTVASPVAINIAATGGKNHKVKIPQGTVITRIDGATVNANSISATIPGAEDIAGFITGASINGALQWGIPNIGLAFATPVTLGINVGAEFNGQTLSVARSTSGNSAWTADGIVNPSCVVADGLCSFQITKASYFATYTIAETTTSSGSSSGGSGSGDGLSDGLGCGSHDCSGNVVAAASQAQVSSPSQTFFEEGVLGITSEDEGQETAVASEGETQKLAQGDV